MKFQILSSMVSGPAEVENQKEPDPSHVQTSYSTGALSGFFHPPDRRRAFNMKNFDLPGMRGTNRVDLAQVFKLLTGYEPLELKTAK